MVSSCQIRIRLAFGLQAELVAYEQVDNVPVPLVVDVLCWQFAGEESDGSEADSSEAHDDRRHPFTIRGGKQF